MNPRSVFVANVLILVVIGSSGCESHQLADAGPQLTDGGPLLPVYVEMVASRIEGDRLVPADCPPDRLCRLVVEVDDPLQAMTAILATRGQSTRDVLVGSLTLSATAYNVNERGTTWSWHITAPGFSRSAPEVCDTGPDLIETAVKEGKIAEGAWVCFWSLMPYRVRRADGTALDTASQGPTD